MSNQGSCQCGAIAFEFEGPSFLTFCHCKNCQKLHGSAFAPFLHAESKTFKWLKGEEFLSYFNSSSHLRRAFCSKCGSTLPIVSHALNHIAVPASAMDTPIVQQPVAHFYTRSQASWFCIGDNAQQYETTPLGGIREVYERVLSMNET
ncbi:GFA family protein [Leptolyngbya sp. NK1-12]|uniref:GFA family protein n=1 Tax=Leptolyngbya sp. NK1-12 TaxID=2547451 RepID=A0AA96WIL0_9CYAN|nr:GFA family protein [Leptolyngbya sp. NK1-12]WNZ25840.1 GFA family protein [Leptolyngbya sp. NK1-12]